MLEIIENFQNPQEDYGKKGNNLNILRNLFQNNKDIIVPETLILTKSLYQKILNENKNKDLSNYQNIYISPTLQKEILTRIHKKFSNQSLVIRSSATCEDSIFFSASGQYSSFLNINSDEKIIIAVKKVYASLFSNNSKLYSELYNINLLNESMIVLLQPLAPVIKSGVMFSADPLGSKKYIIEWTKGLGTNVVEGVENVKHLEIDYASKKEIQDEEVKRLIEIVDIIKERFQYDVDIEWGIDKDKKIYIFQTRPIIYKNIPFDINYDSNLINRKCDVISKGFAIGKIKNISTESKGYLLFQDIKYDFNNLKLLLNSKGIILREKTELSHFANILRELVKPCICIKDFKYKEDNVYVIDALNGNIIDFEVLNPKDKINLMFSYFNYLKMILNDSFLKYNGILNIYNDDKYEEVVFDINEEILIKMLEENGFKKKIVMQKIYTYDFKDNSLISNNTIFRIQITNGKINIQFKTLDMEQEKYRKEKGIIINFDTLENAKEFMDGFGMIETGYQERKIIKYELGDILVNVIKWPNANPYLGIEAKSVDELEKINQRLDLNQYTITSYGGKQIFKRLNLSLNNCKFGGK